jgi:glutamyl-tRNA synthetase
LLGWSPPEGQELFSLASMIESFRLEDVNHSPAFFDVVKLTHMNGEYIRALTTDAFIAACQPWLTGDRAPWPVESFDPAVFARLAPLVQERVAVLGEVPAMIDFMFLDPVPMDEESWAKSVTNDELAVTILNAAIAAYRELAGRWDHDALHAATLAVGEGVGRKLGKAQAPIRVAVTGRRVGPPLFEALEVLGPDRTLDRLERARERASGPVT